MEVRVIKLLAAILGITQVRGLFWCCGSDNRTASVYPRRCARCESMKTTGLSVQTGARTSFILFALVFNIFLLQLNCMLTFSRVPEATCYAYTIHVICTNQIRVVLTRPFQHHPYYEHVIHCYCQPLILMSCMYSTYMYIYVCIYVVHICTYMYI